LDEGPDGTAKESITAGGFASDYMMDFTSLKTSDLPDGRRQYSSTTHCQFGISGGTVRIHSQLCCHQSSRQGVEA